MRIGELSQLTGCPIGSIRFYEEKGLLKNIQRNLGGQRAYAEKDVKRLQFIMLCRTNGMPLQCIRNMIQFMDDSSLGSEWLLKNVEGYIAAVHQKHEDLNRLENYLQTIRQKLIDNRSLEDVEAAKE